MNTKNSMAFLIRSLILKVMFWTICNSLKGHSSTGHDNCFTWHDNKTTLFLTCRVRNFQLPVTFIHETSNTKVKCMIIRKLQCSPKEKKISINRHNHTVTLVLEENKFDQNYDGGWHCKQGKSTQNTTVSVSKGIIIDTWVELRGTTTLSGNGTKTIHLECSSCRKPHGLYVEFFENGVTAGSVHQDKVGNCVYDQLTCPPDKCNCLPTANFFSFRLEVKNVQTQVNYSCEMYFDDEERKGSFHITASKTFTGNNFIVRENDTTIIRNNTIVRNNRQTTTKIKGQDEIVSTTSTTKYNINNSKKEPRNIYITILLPVFGFIGLIVISLIIWYFKCHRKGMYAKDLTEAKESEELCLLQSSKPSNNAVLCKSCEKENRQETATILCFDCRQFYCESCFSLHDKTDFLSIHETVRAEKVPPSFDILIFICSEDGHKGSPLLFLCKNHLELCCKTCKDAKHSNCETKYIQDISADNVSKFVNRHMSKYNLLKEKLVFNEQYLVNSLDTFKTQLSLLKSQMNRFKGSETFRLLIDTKLASHISDVKENIFSELDERRKQWSTEAQGWLEKNRRCQRFIENQKQVLNFLAKYGNNSCVYIAEKTFDNMISKIKRYIENDEKLFYTLELRRNLKNETINLMRKNAPKSRISILCEQFFSRRMRTCTSGSIRPETEMPHSIPENTSLMSDNPVISFDEDDETISVEMNLITPVTEPNSE